MIKLGICGFGYTGSGAVVDLLSEYSDVFVAGGDKEFILSYVPDGLEDLEYHLMMQSDKYFSSDIAIMRFREYIRKCTHERNNIYMKLTNGKLVEYCDEYLGNICEISWKGKWLIDPWLISPFRKKIKYSIMGRIIPKNSKLYRSVFYRDMYFSIEPSNFYRETESFLNKIIGFDAKKDGVIIMNQSFPANAPQRSMKLFGDGTKAIIVDRDPRDIFILAKDYAKPLWMPLGNIDDYILYFKKLHPKHTEDNNILHIQFEDLIFNYEATRDRIEQFCGLSSEKHTDPLKRFDPKVSLKNTRLFEKTDRYQAQIKAIEEQLPEFLYDFSRYSEIDTAKVDKW